MTVIARSTQRLSNLIKYEFDPATRHCRDQITYNGVAKSFKIGDLVGANGVVPATADAIVGIIVDDVDAPATTDTVLPILARGTAGVSDVGLVLGTLALADVKVALLAKNIKVLTAV